MLRIDSVRMVRPIKETNGKLRLEGACMKEGLQGQGLGIHAVGPQDSVLTKKPRTVH